MNLLNIFLRKCYSISQLNIDSFLVANFTIIQNTIPTHASEALESYPLDPKERISIYRSSISHIDLFLKSFIIHIKALNDNYNQMDDNLDFEHLTNNFKFIDHFKDFYYFKSDTEDNKDIIVVMRNSPLSSSSISDYLNS